MPRPKLPYPTPKELEVLQILWDHEPCTVRQVMEILNKRRRRAYTSVMSLLNVMTDKGLLMRRSQGRAFLYKSRIGREKTLSGLTGDLLNRAFSGSVAELLTHMLDQSKPSVAELDKMVQIIDDYRNGRRVR